MAVGQRKHGTQLAHRGITGISVCGYKSIREEQGIEIRPLTLIAGANSSGKSSIMQPLLMLKQTLEASYDPGALLLDGPNVRFTSSDQFLSRGERGKKTGNFSTGVRVDDETTVTIHFDRSGGQIGIPRMDVRNGRSFTLTPSMQHEEIAAILPKSMSDLHDAIARDTHTTAEWKVVRERCFLTCVLSLKDKKVQSFFDPGEVTPAASVLPRIRDTIHLPGLRGNPERTYPVTAVGSAFPGTFQSYVASVIARWQEEPGAQKLEELAGQLSSLGLTWKAAARRVSETQVELQVGRLPHCARGGARDLVSVADVGLGVSQTLPVLVALLVARPGQMVYLEQPEIHLHPRAQVAMAEVLARAAQRGVRVVAETHSSLLLLGVQSLVAEGKLPPNLVKLHWFERNDAGVTAVRSADLDETGAFGDWPEDFADVSLDAESRYLSAASRREE